MPELGERFRAAREGRGLSLSEVAEQIRIRSVYLSAIEDENWAAIGAPVYVRGFLRTYARFLGLEPEEMVAEFNAQAPTPQPPPPPHPTPSSAEYLGTDRPARTSPMLWIAGLVAVVLVAFVFYNELQLHEHKARAPVAAVPSELPSNVPANGPGVMAGLPSMGPPASPGPGADGPHSLEVTISSPSWLRVTVDGNVSMEGTFPAGTVKRFHGKSAVLRIGNAGGVKVSVDGKNLGKMGSSGDVVERSFAL